MSSPGKSPHTAVNYRITEHWNATSIVFLVLAIAGLLGTLAWNIVAVVERRDYLGDWTGSGSAVSSMLVDLLVMAIAGCVLIVVESRRLGMKRAWLYIVLSGLTAIAFTFPLFLAMRERRLVALAALDRASTDA